MLGNRVYGRKDPWGDRVVTVNGNVSGYFGVIHYRNVRCMEHTGLDLLRYFA